MHDWSDKTFDWRGLGEAIDMIADELRRWRVPVHDAKEKWGTARIYLRFGWSMVHDMLYPGYAFCQYKSKRVWALDCYYGHWIVRPLNWIVVPLHKLVYRRAYARAINKYPHLRAEILDCPDFPELLEGL